jgi:hypothetical protein
VVNFISYEGERGRRIIDILIILTYISPIKRQQLNKASCDSNHDNL